MESVATLDLANGTSWGIVAGNRPASAIVSRLVEAMQLVPCGNPARQFLVSVEENAGQRICLPSADDGTVVCAVDPAEDANTLIIQLVRVASMIALDAECRGGVLLHGALAERDGCGVILAGPGGIGKTTASQRLSHPWRSLSDDATLVVCDEQGVYWAHPWPTWSDFAFGGNGGSWDVQHAVPLKSIFFMSQAREDRAELLGSAQAVCMLIESSEQISIPISRSMGKDELRDLRLHRFDNICALAQVVTCYLLHLSPNGVFWCEMERAMAEDSESEL